MCILRHTFLSMLAAEVIPESCTCLTSFYTVFADVFHVRPLRMAAYQCYTCFFLLIASICAISELPCWATPSGLHLQALKVSRDTNLKLIDGLKGLFEAVSGHAGWKFFNLHDQS